jgi:uncharacterized membrane protein YfcA
MFFVSFLYSNLGLGGGMLYVPIMVFVATSMNRLEIIPVSLFLSLMTQLPAAYTHFKKELVNIKLGLILGAATIPGVVLGVLIGTITTDVYAYCLFSLLLFITGIRMLIDIHNKKFDKMTTDRDYSTTQFVGVCFISIGTGVVSAFFGVGGGIITVPVLIYLLGMYPRRAIGTSALMIVFTSMVGFICYSLLAFDAITLPGFAVRSVPDLQFDLAIILGLVVLIGAYLGSSWGLKSLKTKNVQTIFIIIVFIAGFQLLLRALGFF